MSTMADTPKADHAEWTDLLDQLTEKHEGQFVTIELLDSKYGDQHEAEHLPFAYATYDPRDDVVIVAVGGRSAQYPVVLRHMVWHPSDVRVAPGDAFRVVDPDGTATLVTFHPTESAAS
jgi:hypothetical protein